MVLAGPGSGKTKVIVERTRRLIENEGASPDAILVITFTKAAAIEMQVRFLKITDNSYPEVSFGTFHSIFYQIIKHSVSGKETPIEIADDRFKYNIIKDAITTLKADGALTSDKYDDAVSRIPDIISEISRIKNCSLGPEMCHETILKAEHFMYVYERYNKELKGFGKIDFDDMLSRCREVLLENKNEQKFWQERFKYILIDEYQDINPVQYDVVRLLLGDRKNIFAVGDDDQSIYGFRGSDPGIMLRFMEDFKENNPVLIVLDTNYRCDRSILDASLKVIDVNTVRFKKDIHSSKEDGYGNVYVRRYESRARQNRAIAFFLGKNMDRLSDIAVLFRTNSEAKALAALLESEGIMSNLSGTQKNYLDDKAVELCLLYLSFADGGRKRSDFLKIINTPQRYISRESAFKDTVNEADILNFYRGNRDRQKEVKKFFTLINTLSHLRPSLSVSFVQKMLELDKMYPNSRENFEILKAMASKCRTNRELLELAKKEREKMSKTPSKKNVYDGPFVRLLTMHASKGLEFDTVWIPDLNEGIIPSRSAVTLEETEEERRMLYVAMTRARRALIMSYITGSKENPMLPTRFLRPVKNLWDETYGEINQTSSEPSSGSSTSSSNSASSRYSSKASATASYSSSSEM